MFDVLSHRAGGMVGPCSRYVLTVRSIFRRARERFRPCSRFASNLLAVCFDCSRGIFLPVLRYVSTVLEVSFNHSRGIFLLVSSYVSTVLEVCFDRSRGMFRPCSR